MNNKRRIKAQTAMEIVAGIGLALLMWLGMQFPPAFTERPSTSGEQTP